jgi:Fe-S-cluster containining protein
MPDGRGLHVENDTVRTPLPLIRLAAAEVGRHEPVTANVQLTFGNRPVDLEITLPADSVSATDLLPIYQGLTNLVIDIGVEAVEHRGEAVSCRKGCGACCRQPVPISKIEARAIARLVDDLPEPRRSIVRERFVDARYRLAAAGLLEAFAHPERVTGTDAMANSARYFNLGIACPFLEDESCSIHPDRPLACREYLVTSPAENCSRPAESELRPVPLPARVAAAVRAGDRPTPDGVGWVLLALAPDWAATHPEPPPRPGPELFQEFFDRLLPRTDWIEETNLRPFLTAVGWAVGAEVGPGDWLAVERGIGDTDEAADRWHEVVFATPRPTRVRLARIVNAGRVRIQPAVPDDVAPQVRLAAAICQQYRLR